MKYNLKNKPSYGIGTFEFKKEAMEWFEGFKKELREKYIALCEMRIGDIRADNQAFLIEEILDAEADEIFGEEEG